MVVDIETTGGRSSSDRITEIGAVRVRNHEVVSEWHSLLNPQRTIPPRITKLTGISNDMVRGAPVFAEIAGNFLAFMHDSIFVAHNVNFDYGFLSQEYSRLERRFRFPKFCTVAGIGGIIRVMIPTAWALCARPIPFCLKTTIVRFATRRQQPTYYVS